MADPITIDETCSCGATIRVVGSPWPAEKTGGAVSAVEIVQDWRGTHWHAAHATVSDETGGVGQIDQGDDERGAEA